MSVCHLAQQLLTTSCLTYRPERKTDVGLSCLAAPLATHTSLKRNVSQSNQFGMELQRRTPGLLLLVSLFPPAAAMTVYDPRFCYLLDGLLGLYGLIITGMFVKERFFKTKVKTTDESIYSDLQGQDAGGYAPLMRGDPERGRNRRMMDDDTYTDLTKRTDGEYKELPVKRERQRKNDQVYQGLSSATKDTYDSLQMKPLSAR